MNHLKNRNVNLATSPGLLTKEVLWHPSLRSPAHLSLMMYPSITHKGKGGSQSCSRLFSAALVGSAPQWKLPAKEDDYANLNQTPSPRKLQSLPGRTRGGLGWGRSWWVCPGHIPPGKGQTQLVLEQCHLIHHLMLLGLSVTSHPWLKWPFQPVQCGLQVGLWFISSYIVIKCLLF